MADLPFDTVFASTDVLIRMVAAMACGAAIGFDREWTGRPAGLRTHMIVSLASALLTVLAFELAASAGRTSDAIQSDPVRVVEAILTGVAFLGAGTIIRTRGEVQGVTTGASLWLSGALGIACGGGYFVMALIGVVLAVTIITILGLVERWVRARNGKSDSTEE